MSAIPVHGGSVSDFLLIRPLALALLAMMAAGGGSELSGQAPKPVTREVPVRKVPLADVLRLGPADLTLGSEDEEGPYLFGSTMTLARGGDGILYVSEYPEGTIKAFAPDGRHLVTFGGRGRGPGEFMNPLSLYHDGDSTLYASQSYFGTSVLTAKGGRIEYRKAFNVGVGGRTHCLMGDTLVESGWTNGRMLHVLRDDFSVLRSFGEGWSRDTIERVREMENGMATRVTCDARNQRLYLTNAVGARLRAYRLDGTLLWEAELPGFRYATYRAQGSNGAAYFFNDDFVDAPIPAGDDRLLVSIHRVDYQRAPRRRSPISAPAPPVVSRTLYVLDAQTGRILSRSDLQESLGMVVDDTTTLQIRMDPFPQIVRRRITFNDRS